MKQRNGIWMSDFRLSNGERVRLSLKTTDKAQAKLKQAELQITMEKALTEPSSKALAGSSGAPPRHPIKAAFKLAMRAWEPWRTSTSPETIQGNYAHVVQHFGELRDLATLTKEDMLQYTEKLRSQGKSPSTINQRLSLISVLQKVVGLDPLKMPRQKTRKGRIRILSYQEEARVVSWFRTNGRAAPRDLDMADLVVFLIDTGFRLSEALGLLSHEVDWDTGAVPAWETKGDLPRFVPMTSRVRAILAGRRHLERPFGTFTKDVAEDYWGEMRRGIGVKIERDPEFVLHALRHTCASRLVASGMDAFRVQKWMGHKDIKTTMLYVTLYAPDLQDLANALDSRRIDANVFVPKSVPKLDNPQVPKHNPVQLHRPTPQGTQARAPIRRSVGNRLLIRRSLVRAQVGEPDLAW